MSEWQPIETAPKDGNDVLVYVSMFALERDKMGELFVNRACVDGGYISIGTLPFDGLRSDSAEPTHWMPLPSPPKEQP